MARAPRVRYGYQAIPSVNFTNQDIICKENKHCFWDQPKTLDTQYSFVTLQWIMHV